MRVLVGCEHTGTVRTAFVRAGHDAYSCDLLPDRVGNVSRHLQMDVFEAIERHGPWDIIILHPDCTYLCAAGLHWNRRVVGRHMLTLRALDFVWRLWQSAILHARVGVCMENPVGCISTKLALPPPQYIQPYDFEENASKKTGLWLYRLPPLWATRRVPGRRVMYKGKEVERWDNQTDSGQNRLTPSDDRWALRAATYPGVAEAMAQQWGQLKYRRS